MIPIAAIQKALLIRLDQAKFWGRGVCMVDQWGNLSEYPLDLVNAFLAP